MTYDFTKGADRRHDGSLKYMEEKLNADPKLIPMWIADMDFATLPEVSEDLEKLARYGVFGYTAPGEGYKNSVKSWLKERHHTDIEKEWILPMPGIVPALRVVIQALTRPEDAILIFPPVYFPFEKSIVQSGRTCIKCELLEDNLSYTMDFDALEKQIRENDVKMIILCSPHNPVGRVWSFEELKKLGEICEKYNVIMVSDEIHMDFSRRKEHTTFLNAAPFWKEHTVVCTAPSKTFNLAGLQVSNLIIPNKEMFEKIEKQMTINGLSEPNVFGLVANQSAYEHGAKWVDELNAALEENVAYIEEYLKENLPQIKISNDEGLYMVWLDCRELGIPSDQLADFWYQKGHVWMHDGTIFGAPGFMRMNIACPKSTVQRALEQMKEAVDEYNSKK